MNPLIIEAILFRYSRKQKRKSAATGDFAKMPSVFITVQIRESDMQAVDLMKHLVAKGDVKVGNSPQELDPDTVMISLQGIEPDGVSRIISDAKQWSEDVGFAFFVDEDAVRSSVSQNGAIEKENATVITMLEL